MIEPRWTPAPAEDGRRLHSINPEGFEIVDFRPPAPGELFADCRGPAAWIWTTTLHHNTARLIVQPTISPVNP